ncbi:hypothetical protein SSAG_00600 [Streptomyces sp. Mg1]|nr:hypothetical protein SSAG_00600 [Streptomyces sp. Mg1]RPK42274.1 hypothetical protein EES37_18935 [Streptomyces sp. ADI91-18]
MQWQSPLRGEGLCHLRRALAGVRAVGRRRSESASLVGGKATEVGGTAKDQAANVVGEATAQA